MIRVWMGYPTVSSGMCAYGITDAKGIVKCGIEQAYNDGKINWRKPISCHLFPIRIKKSKRDKNDLVIMNPGKIFAKPHAALVKN